MIEQELSNYWKTVVNTLQDGVMIVDNDGTIVSVNEAFEVITGYSQTEILGKSCTLLNCNTCKVVREKQGAHWCSMFKSGALKMHKCVLRCKGGAYVHVVKNASILRDKAGKVIGAVESLTDITALMQKEIQIEKLPARTAGRRSVFRNHRRHRIDTGRIRPGGQRLPVRRPGDRLR